MVAARSVPGADAASITRARAGRFETVASSHNVAIAADILQYDLRTGPCVDAVEKESVFRSDDLALDSRWPVFGAAAAENHGLHSVLSIRLTLDDEDTLAGLNVYAFKPHAFDDVAFGVAMLAATHAATVMSRLVTEERTNLARALAMNRDIGLATGVLMANHDLTREEAHDLLRIASQRNGRKVAEIAAEVTHTGVLDLT